MIGGVPEEKAIRLRVRFGVTGALALQFERRYHARYVRRKDAA
jgi:hypothetical protein